MKRSLGLAIFFASTLVRVNSADAPATAAPINYQQPPVVRFDYGLVRVWNAKAEPPQGAGQVPEAKLGDAIVAELKQIDAWLCANLDAGAWTNDIDAEDPLLRRVIESRNLAPTLRAARWLQMMKNADASPNAAEEGEADKKNVGLLAALKSSPAWSDNVLPAKDENGTPLDPVNPKDATRIVKTCQKALAFLSSFRKRKAAEFVLRINDLRLPGLPVTAQEEGVDWRSASDRLEAGTFTWWRIKLRASEDPGLDRAWTEIMHKIEPHYSLPSQLTLSLPGELVALPTNVTATAEDSRCRFVLIATTQLPRVEKKLAIGDAVYPLDVRERQNEIRKGEVVEVDDDPNAALPYVVHFSQAGGSKHYAAKDLARLPPDPVPVGVVRVWNMETNESRWEEAQKNEVPEAKIGDHLVVEVRNFDGWLCNQVDQGFLRDDPLIQKVSKGLDILIKAKTFSHAVKVGGAIYQLGNKTHYTGADIVRQLQKDAASNPDLAALPFPLLGPEKLSKIGGHISTPAALAPAATTATPVPTATAAPARTTTRLSVPTPTPAETSRETTRKSDEIKAVEFLAPYQEAHSLLRELVKAKIRALELTVNDLVLGVTPDNSDFAPIYESQRPAGDPAEDTYHWLKFALAKRVATSKDEEKIAEDPFKRLLEKPSFVMPSKVTLTLKSGSETLALPSAVTPQAKDKRCRFNLIGISRWMFWSITFVFALIAISLGFFTAKTDILRDPCRRRPEGVEPVSLARTQMAFWFVVIAAAFLFLWVTTGNIATINGTCLVLLAIGTTTAVTSARMSEPRHRQKDLSDALQKTPHEMLKMTPGALRTAITARLNKLEKDPPDELTSDEKNELLQILDRHREEIDCFINNKPNWLPKTVYFWKYRLRTVFEDLLTEETGTYDFQRFQVLAWTVILGTVFVVKVFYDRVMPTFDSNVLLLMGISSGAYLTFKKFGADRNDSAPKPESKPVADAQT